MAVSGLATSFIGANSTNFTPGRERGISRITVHHMAGIMSSNDCGRVFQSENRGASAHYGIGVNGDVAAYVDEENTAWSDGNWSSNTQTISIETSNNGGPAEWPVSDPSFDSLCRLVADIATRNHLGRLVVGQNLFKHQDFKATACPGPYLVARMQAIADRANALMGGEMPAPAPAPAPSNGKSIDEIANEVIKGYWGNGAERERNIRNAGYEYFAVQARVNEKLGYGGGTVSKSEANNQALDAVARAVIRGDYGNGEDRARNLAAAGFDYGSIQTRVNVILGGGGASNPTPDLNAVADAVIRGDYGNGVDRRARLEAAGYNYSAVQVIVNQKLGV